MAIINMNPEKKDDIPVLPMKPYHGVISAVWDIGKQIKNWEGKESVVHQIMVRVEVNKTIDVECEFKGKRYAPISWITLYDSYNEKANFVKLAEAAFGEKLTPEDFAAFDTDTLIGRNLTVNIGHTKNGKAKITGFSPAMDGMPIMTPELPQDMPDWVKDKVDSALKEDGVQQQQQSQRLVPPVQPEFSVPETSRDEENLPF